MNELKVRTSPTCSRDAHSLCDGTFWSQASNAYVRCGCTCLHIISASDGASQEDQ